MNTIKNKNVRYISFVLYAMFVCYVASVIANVVYGDISNLNTKIYTITSVMGAVCIFAIIKKQKWGIYGFVIYNIALGAYNIIEYGFSGNTIKGIVMGIIICAFIVMESLKRCER
ncbi:hypothetical protein [Clostridium frigidicarnis]|uniref:Uncharacterized protein n=1 Tax=Clostridium frigidicarnis TaxID=84698 RepID=A0A1I0YU84_9CLOT|nr:hypothetical protein [Clostridium frigidicarnis]SFB15683.1 hypothetical protein SAMN04488528_101492 [Clostridium frigidicarnis]